ncbi:MAG: rhomboid family intramembrane serine protease [Nannocystaceae bacterium]
MVYPPPTPWLTLGLCVGLVALQGALAHDLVPPPWSPLPAGPRDPQLELVRYGARSAALVADAGESWRLFTAHFVHTGWVHLFFNLVFFLPVAAALECVLCRLDFSLLLLFSAGSAGLVSLLCTPEISVGVSGLVFALLSASVLVGLRHQRLLHPAIHRHFGLAVLPFLVLLVLSGLGNQQVDHASHMGGLVAGCVAGPWLRLEARGPRGPRRSRRGDMLRVAPVALMTCVALVGAPRLAHGGQLPIRYRCSDLFEVEAPAGWAPRFGPLGELRFQSSSALVSASIYSVPSWALAQPQLWYELHKLGPLLRVGEIAALQPVARGESGRPDGGSALWHRFRFRRDNRVFFADVFFIAAPNGPIALGFEVPAEWADKYAKTRARMLRSVAIARPGDTHAG